MPVIKKKIKIIYHLLPNIIGGAERFLFNMVKYINRERFEPVIFSYSHGVATQMFKSLDVEVRIIDTNYPKRLSNLINFLKSSKVDIAQSNYFNYPLAMAANIADIPHIWNVQGHIDVACSLNLKQRQYLLNAITPLSEEIVCASKFLKQQFRKIRTSKIEVIYNGVDLDEINSTDPDYTLLKKSDCNNDCLSIGMVANFSPQKRHIDFILAAKKIKRYLPNTKFFIIGSTYRIKESLDYAKYLYKIVKDMNMDEHIVFAGFHKDILRIIVSMSLVTLPSIGEGFGMAILEAMALGKPVVASNSGGIPELVKDKVTGLLVPPKNPKKLAEAMIKILKNPQKAKMMGEAGRRRARRLFDIKRIAHQYEELYQKIYNKSAKS